MSEIRPKLAEFLKELDRLVGAPPLDVYVSGGVAVLLGYGGETDTKDFDLIRADDRLKPVQKAAGKNSSLHERTGYFLDLVPPIFPWAPGIRERSIPIEAGLTNLRLRLLEAHDLIISKLLRFHAKDRGDIETLTRHETFSADVLVERYRAAREELKFYMIDKVEKADKNLNAVLVEILGEAPVEFDEVIY